MRKKRGKLERKPHLIREYLSHHEEKVERNTDGKDLSAEPSSNFLYYFGEKNELHFFPQNENTLKIKILIMNQ